MVTTIQNLGKLSSREILVVLLVLAGLESTMHQPGGSSVGLIPKRQEPEGWVYNKFDVIRSLANRTPMVRMRIKQIEIETALNQLGDKRGLAVLDDFGMRAILPVVRKLNTNSLVPVGFETELVQSLENSGWSKGDEKEQVKVALKCWKRLR